MLTSDNGPNFVSEEFKAYLKESGIKHQRVTAKWVQANGEVERENSSVLKRLRFAHAEGMNWKRELVNACSFKARTPAREFPLIRPCLFLNSSLGSLSLTFLTVISKSMSFTNGPLDVAPALA